MKKITQFINNYPKTGAYYLNLLIFVCVYFISYTPVKGFFEGVAASLFSLFGVYCFLSHNPNRKEYWYSYTASLKKLICVFLDEDIISARNSTNSKFYCEGKRDYLELSHHERPIYMEFMWEEMKKRILSRPFSEGSFKQSVTYAEWKEKLGIIEIPAEEFDMFVDNILENYK